MSKKQDVRFAFVPHAGCVCEQCLMCGSRDFTYTYEFNPHGGKNMSCECEFVPGIKGVTKIEGYDPKALKKQWKAVRDLRLGLGITEAETKAVLSATGITSIMDVDMEVFRREWQKAKDALGYDATTSQIAEEMAKKRSVWLDVYEAD